MTGAGVNPVSGARWNRVLDPVLPGDPIPGGVEDHREGRDSYSEAGRPERELPEKIPCPTEARRPEP